MSIDVPCKLDRDTILEKAESGFIPCGSCGGLGGGKRVFDRESDTSTTEWCDACNGYGLKRVGRHIAMHQAQERLGLASTV